jgi:oligoendopeptidase F
MFQTLPKDYKELYEWDWAKFEPYARDLSERPINAANVEEWLKDWTSLDQCYDEVYNRLYVATTINTADKESEERYVRFMDELYPKAMEAGQVLKEKLLESGLQPAGFEVPLRNMRAEADLFRKENLPLFSEETKLTSEYDKIIGSQTVLWDGEERTVSQVKAVSIDPDRDRREKAFRLVAERQLADQDALNTRWGKFLDLRANMTKNAGKPDYRSFRWQQLLRFDYQPKDCVSFHKAIEEAVVPAAKRIYERRRQQLGLTTLRPWDLDVDSTGQPPLKPYQTIDELKNKTLSVFKHVDPKLGEYFETMMSEGLLDLDNRKNKAPGGYCTAFGRVQRPFIFANAVGLQDDVMTLVHEGGHSFHVFESAHLPYNQQLAVGMEFAEVASMGMELLASPYLLKNLAATTLPKMPPALASKTWNDRSASGRIWLWWMPSSTGSTKIQRFPPIQNNATRPGLRCGNVSWAVWIIPGWKM